VSAEPGGHTACYYHDYYYYCHDLTLPYLSFSCLHRLGNGQLTLKPYQFDQKCIPNVSEFVNFGSITPRKIFNINTKYFHFSPISMTVDGWTNILLVSEMLLVMLVYPVSIHCCLLSALLSNMESGHDHLEPIINPYGCTLPTRVAGG